MFTDARAPGWSIDGGNDYIKVSWPSGYNYVEDTESLVITSKSTLNDILQKTCWGTKGKSGKEPLRYVLVKNMELEHLTAVLSDLENASLSSPTQGIHERVPLYLQLALVHWWGYKKGYLDAHRNWMEHLPDGY